MRTQAGYGYSTNTDSDAKDIDSDADDADSDADDTDSDADDADSDAVGSRSWRRTSRCRRPGPVCRSECCDECGSRVLSWLLACLLPSLLPSLPSLLCSLSLSLHAYHCAARLVRRSRLVRGAGGQVKAERSELKRKVKGLYEDQALALKPGAPPLQPLLQPPPLRRRRCVGRTGAMRGRGGMGGGMGAGC